MGKLRIENVDTLLSGRGLWPTSRVEGVPLFDFSDSEWLLGLCERLGIGVLGIEGFTLSGSDLCPDMDYIADFSVLLDRDAFEAESVKSARKFLHMAAAAPNLLFEYVLANRDTTTR